MPPLRTQSVTHEEFEVAMNKLRDTLDRLLIPQKEEIERHRKTLYGNGDAGMDERLRNIERDLGILKKLAYAAVITIGGYVTIELFKLVF